MRYRILEHPADLKIKSFGKTKEELFLNALLGMIEALKPEDRKSDKMIKREIKIKSTDAATLLVDFLSEVLYLIQVNKEIYKDIQFQTLSETELEGELLGQKAGRFNEDIKAVTYYDLDIRRKKDGSWEATVLFDI